MFHFSVFFDNQFQNIQLNQVYDSSIIFSQNIQLNHVLDLFVSINGLNQVFNVSNIFFQKISWSHHIKLKVEVKGISSDREQVIEIFCNPEKLISGQQARIWILQKDWTTKIELLNINKIYNSWVRIKKETLNTPKKAYWLWWSLKKGFSSIFSRKAA